MNAYPDIIEVRRGTHRVRHHADTGGFVLPQTACGRYIWGDYLDAAGHPMTAIDGSELSHWCAMCKKIERAGYVQTA